MYLKQGHCLHNDKYRLLNVLGEGGFSLTYRGAWKTEVQGNLGKVPTFIPVCIKEYFFKDHCFRNTLTGFVETNSETGKEIFYKNKEKIIKEARILAEVHHPNVVNVLEVFKQNNTVYIVMEFISGRSLKHEVEQYGVFDEEKLKKNICVVGRALNYVHEKNILHLDIKPSNILLDNNNNPKLIDFGISKKYDLSNDQETSTTLLAASKGFASIEQYDSEGIQSFSPCPDIYSLGATMYYLVTGHVPTESILRSTKGLQNPREINPNISEKTENVILKAMALNASERYQTVMELLLDLGCNPDNDKTDITSTVLTEYPGIDYKMTGDPIDFDADDRTQFHSKPVNITEWEKEYGWVFLITPFLISGLMAFFLFANIKEKIPEEPSTDFIPILNLADSVNTSVNSTEVVQVNNNASNNNITDNQSNSVANTVQKPEEIKQEKYNKALDDARAAFSNNEFARSLELLDIVESYEKTSETVQFRNRIEQEIEKIEINNRKELYVDQMKLGIFVVVKRKSDGLIGAVDDKYIIKIPCIYKSTDPAAGNNRLFLKENNKYDKYGPDGEIIEYDTTDLN